MLKNWLFFCCQVIVWFVSKLTILHEYSLHAVILVITQYTDLKYERIRACWKKLVPFY